MSQVLGALDALVKDWVRRVSAAKGMVEPVLSEVCAAEPLPALLPTLVVRSQPLPDVRQDLHLRLIPPGCARSWR